MKNIKLEFNRSSGFGFQKCLFRNFQFHRRDPRLGLGRLSGVSDGTWENEYSVSVLTAFIVIIAGRDLNNRPGMNKYRTKKCVNIGVVAV